jgi:hypothetical protein
MYANRQQDQPLDEDDVDRELPQLIIGLCVNNWAMFHGRNALIEAILELLSPIHHSKLSIHSAVYACEFNTSVLSTIIPASSSPEEAKALEDEKAVRVLHAEGFEEAATKYKIGFDTIQDDIERFEGVGKEAFTAELSGVTIRVVENCLSSPFGKQFLEHVLDVCLVRRLINKNLINRRFRRAPSQKKIRQSLEAIMAILTAPEILGTLELPCASMLPGWDAYVKSHGGAAETIFGLFCHSIDVLGGCVGRSKSEVSPDLAEKLVLAILKKENRILEYSFNQVYELMPVPGEERLYVYRGLEDLHLFSLMKCGVTDMGGKL